MPQDAIDQLLRLNPDQQREAIGRLTPQERQAIMGMIQQRQVPTKPAKPPSFGASGSWPAPTVPGLQGAIPADAQLRAQTPSERWESFSQAHPYLTHPITAATRIGAGVSEGVQNIVGAFPATYHAIRDPLTPEEQADPAYSGFGSSVTTPIRRLTLEEQFRLFDQAGAELRADRPGAAAFHLMTSLVPFGGPLAAHIEQRFHDDPYGAIGEALTYYVAPNISKEVRGSRTVGELRAMVSDLANDIQNRARIKAREFGQTLTKTSAPDVTRPAVEKFKSAADRAKATQTRVDEARRLLNEERAKTAAEKNLQRQQKYERNLAQAEKDAAEANAAAQKETAGQLAANREATATNARRESIERSLPVGSQKLGERVQDLDSKLREEGNEKYDGVRKAVADDPGVPLTGELDQKGKEIIPNLVKAAEYAQQNILKGSAESIKQLRELVRRGEALEAAGPPEEEGIQTPKGFVTPGDPLYEMLREQGALRLNLGAENITFDQLQGYSSEIGTKLAKGGLPGDVYQALKYLKDKIDTAKTIIADRNGAGAALRNADSFWRNYMDLFYDSDSALTQVREAVGVKNPSEYFNEFMRGKKNEVAVGRLNKLKTQHASDARAVADLAQNLTSAQTELDTLKKATVKPVEAPARTPSKEVKPPEMAVAREVPPGTVRQPTPPTAADIISNRMEELGAKARQWKALSPFELRHALGTGGIFAALIRTHPLTAFTFATLYSLGPKMIGAILDMESVKAAIAQPTPADLLEVQRLPESARAPLVRELKSIIYQERIAGRPLKIAPEIERLIGMGAGAPSGIPQSRKDAMERLGRDPVTGAPQTPSTGAGQRYSHSRTPPSEPESNLSPDTGSGQGLSNTGLQALAGAIAEQEGFYKEGTVPQRQRNPGDISPGGTVAKYDTEKEGWDRLYDQIRSYDPDMTLAEIGRGARGRGGYAEDPNWAAGVAAALSRATGKKITRDMTLDEIDEELSGQQ